MSAPILARVQRILRDDAERALVHAVGDDGLEYKLEAPLGALREVEEGREYVVMLAWSLHALPRALEAAVPSMAAAQAAEGPSALAASPRPPSSVDAAFMALLARGRAPTLQTADPHEPALARQAAATAERRGEAAARQAAATAEPALGIDVLLDELGGGLRRA